MFFGREDVFNWIERSLEGRFVDHILVLHGQRRVGKTSVLKQIPNFLPDKYIQVFFDLQGRTNTTLERFLWWMGREIVRTLQQEGGIHLPRPNRAAFEDDPDYLINEFLPGLRPELGDQVLLLTFDEFDTLDHPDIQETLAKPLINTLRRLMEFEGLSFIFSIGSSGNKLENMQASYTDFFKSALYRKISFLTRDDCTRLITKPVEGILQYDPKAIDLIYEITSGHPYFTQLMCHELFSQCQKTGARTITPSDAEAILDDVIERGTVNLKFVWDEASDLEKWILTSLAQLEIGATTRQLHSNLQGQHIRFSEPDIYSAIIRLRDKDILNRDNQFVVHLLLLWLQRNRPFDRVREELAEINPIVNRYIEIADTFRDQGQAEKALENYGYALEEDPLCLNALVNSGVLLAEQEQFKEAAASFEAALAIDDEDVSALTGCCDAYLAWGDQLLREAEPDQARTLYNQILEINPQHLAARQRLAGLYRDLAERDLAAQQDAAALIAFQTAHNLLPEDGALAARLQEVMADKKEAVLASLAAEADAAQRRGDWDAAITAVQNATLICGGDKNFEEKLAQLQTNRRNHQLAALPDQASTLGKAEAWDEAIKVWQNYISLDPPDLKEAQAALDKAQQMKVIQRRYNQALVKMQAKDYPQAIELLRAVIQVDPGYKETSNLLAAAVKASRKVKPNWRRIAWVAVPVLVAVVLTIGYLGIKDTGGWAGFTTWLDFENISEMLSLNPASPTPENITAPSATSDQDIEDELTTYQKARDFADPILANVSSVQPTFKEDFSTEQDYWGEATANFSPMGQPEVGIDVPLSDLIVNGVLQILDEPTQELVYEPNGITEFLGAEDFVLQFDFTPHDFRYGSKFFFGFREEENQAYSLEMSVTESRNGNWIFGISDEGGRTTLASGSTNLNIGQPHQIQLVVKGSQIALYKNGQPLTHIEDDTVTGDRTWMWFSSYKPIQVEIDNIKFWELDKGVEIGPGAQSFDQETEAVAASILEIIADRQPDFEEMFSSGQDYWDETRLTPDGTFISGLVSDGVLRIADEPPEETTYTFGLSTETVSYYRDDPFTDLLGQDFVLQFDFIPHEFNPGTRFMIEFRGYRGQTGQKPGYYQFQLRSDGSWDIQFMGAEGDPLLASGSVHFELGEAAQMRVIAMGDLIALYLDNQPLTIFVDSQTTGDLNAIRILSAEKFQVDLDNIQFWSLGGVEIDLQDESPSEDTIIIEAIRSYIETQPPAFEDVFYITDFYEVSGGSDLERGASGITDVALGWSEELPATVDFALQFEYFIEESSEDIFLDVDFRWGGKWTLMGYYLDIDPTHGTWKIVKFGFPSQVLGSGQIPGSSGMDQWSKVQLVVVGDLLAVTINEELVGVYHDDKWTWDLTRIIFGTMDESAKVRLDKVKFWSLEGVEIEVTDETPSEETPAFYEPILDYIDSHSPTLEDDFSAADMVWGGTSEGLAIFAFVDDDVLTIVDHADNENLTSDHRVPGLTFPVNGLFNATNFALQFDFALDRLDEIGMQFRSTTNQNTYYKVMFSSTGSWRLTQNQDDIYIAGDSNSQLRTDNTLLLIVQDQDLALYLNNRLLYEADDLALTGTLNLIAASGEHGSTGKFDNVKFWNMDGVEP